MKEEPKVLTRMRLSCCWGDNLNEKELNEVVDYINNLQSQLKAKEETMNKLKEWLDQEYEERNKIGNPAIGYAMGQIRRVKRKIEDLEILSKGENK